MKKLALICLLLACSLVTGCHSVGVASDGCRELGEHVCVGIVLEEMDVASFEVEQQAAFKRAVADYVRRLFPGLKGRPQEKWVDEPDPVDAWWNTGIENGRMCDALALLKKYRSAGVTGALELEQRPQAAGCCPCDDTCTDERRCPWESSRLYMIKMGGEALTCAGALEHYNNWAARQTPKVATLGANHPLAKAKLGLSHTLVYIPKD